MAKAKEKLQVARLNDVRVEADYGHEIEFNREDAEHWLEGTQEFVAAIETEIPGWRAST